MPKDGRSAVESVRKHYFGGEWFASYDVLEHFGNRLDLVNHEVYAACINEALERECAAYRYVGGYITPLTSESDISAIEMGLQHPASAVRTHMKLALALFSDRDAPDFRNSMKESISAAEAMCKIIAKDKNATLDSALKAVGDKVGIHPSLKDGFRKIYAYSGDADGIRHAIKDQPTVDSEDALFMLVSCSAFVNYLTVKAAKAGIDVTEAL